MVSHESTHNNILQAEVDTLRARVAELEAKEVAVEHERNYLRVVREMARDLLSRREPEFVFRQIIERACDFVDTEHGFLFVLDRRTGNYSPRIDLGLFASDLPTVRPANLDGLVREVMGSRQVQVIHDYDHWDGRCKTFPYGKLYGLVCVPLISPEELVGVMGVAYVEPDRQFDGEVIERLEDFADLASLAIENIRLYSEVEEGQRLITRITKTLPEIIHVYDFEQDRTIYVNRPVGDLLGYSYEENRKMGHRAATILIHPNDLYLLYAMRDDLQENGAADYVNEFEYRAKNSDGTWVWFRSRNTVFARDESGRVIQTIGSTMNITAEREMLLELRQSEERFRAVFESAAVGIAIINEKGFVLETNPTIQHMLGYSAHEIVDQHYTQFFHPEDARPVREMIRDMGMGRLNHYVVEGRMLRNDNSIIWVRLTGSMVRIGNAIRGVGILEDVTERKQAEDQLRTSESRLRAMLDVIPLLVVIYKDGEILYVNPAGRRLGCPSDDERHNLTDENRQLPDSIMSALHNFAATDATSTNERVEIEIQSHDDNKRWLDFTFLETMLADQAVLVGIGMDITERKAAEEHALALAIEKERVQLLADFVKDAGHDFRTPLAVINTSVHLLEHAKDEERKKMRLNTIRAQVDHLDRLVDALLIMVRHDSERPITMKELNLNQLVSDCVKRMSDQAMARKQHLQLLQAEGRVHVMANTSDLYRALSYVVDNAIRYSPEGTAILVELRLEPPFVQIRVTDNGKGIRPADMERIFDRFHRADDERESGGLGLGLAVAKRIIERHSGSIYLESVYGEGSTFTIELPLFDVDLHVPE